MMEDTKKKKCKGGRREEKRPNKHGGNKARRMVGSKTMKDGRKQGCKEGRTEGRKDGRREGTITFRTLLYSNRRFSSDGVAFVAFVCSLHNFSRFKFLDARDSSAPQPRVLNHMKSTCTAIAAVPAVLTSRQHLQAHLYATWRCFPCCDGACLGARCVECRVNRLTARPVLQHIAQHSSVHLATNQDRFSHLD